MDHTFQTLEFYKILEVLEGFSHTEAAKEQIRNLTPSRKESQVRKDLRDTTEARIILDRMGIPPAVAMKDLTDIIVTAKQGGCLQAGELEQMGAMLTGVKRLKEFLNRCKNLEVSLAYYELELDPLSELSQLIYESIRNGRVEDYASRTLKNLRQEIGKVEERLRTKTESILRKNKKYFSDSFITIKNGRTCLPVKKDYKSMVSGSVIDQSATGATLFIEPAAVSMLNGELEQLRIEEENEVRRILYTLTGVVEENLPVLEKNKHYLEKLDFLFAKGQLSLEMNGIQPSINTERYIQIIQGRHPLMDASTAVPLTFEIGKTEQGIIITGPNTGGKTVSIKTVGLFCLMAQCGLHVPCEEADLCMNSQVLCDIGDGQNITENLSTFSAHISNVMRILDSVNKESLVIMDELGSGTDPAEGMGIAIAILEELRLRGCLFLTTTHYPEVKTYARETKGVTNARMAFDKNTLEPLYLMEIGEAGESCALAIAKRLGMPEEMVEKARAYAYGNWKEGKSQEKFSLQQTGHYPSKGPSIEKDKKAITNKNEMEQLFSIGDSVLVYPDKKKGIVCKTVNEKGMVQIQMPDKKIWLNQKRVKLLVRSAQLYPENYDFSIIFDTVANRKARHKMEKGYQEGLEIRQDEK